MTYKISLVYSQFPNITKNILNKIIYHDILTYRNDNFFICKSHI